MNERTILQAVMSAYRILRARTADRTTIITITLLIVNLVFRAISYLFSENGERIAIILLLLLNTLRTWIEGNGTGVRSLDEIRYARLCDRGKGSSARDHFVAEIQ